MRVIDQLRKLFPGKWVYDRETHNWLGESFNVIPTATMVSRTPNGYSGYATHFYRSDNNEEVLLLQTGHYTAD